MQISLAFHLVGIVFWLGGLLLLTSLLKLLAAPQTALEPLARKLKQLYFFFVLPGLAIALLSGLHQLTARGLSYYFRETHWFHSKLTFLVVLFVLTVIVGFEIRNAAAGRPVKAGRMGAMHGIAALCLVVIIFVTMLGR